MDQRKPTQAPPYRDLAFERYGKACLACGTTEKLAVHHIDGNRLNRNIDNLAPLCHTHHRAMHRKRNLTLQERLDIFKQVIAEVKSRNEAENSSSGQSEPKDMEKDLSRGNA
jgi:predicted restriction endonuclease